MTVDEIELVRRLAEVEPLPREVSEKTEVVLRAAMAVSKGELPAPLGAPLALVDIPDAGRASRSGQRTHRALAGVAAAAVVLGGAGAALATGLGSSARHAPVRAGHLASPPTSNVETAAYVVDHLKAAVDANTAILVTRAQAPNSETGQPVSTETWSSSTSPTTRTEILDSAGSPVRGYLVTVDPRQTTSVSIDYANRTWSATTYPFGSSSSSSSSTPAPLPETPAQAAARLQAAVRAGAVSVVGATTVGGQDAIELRQILPADGSIPAGVLRIWVDPNTYLPIREQDTSSGQSIVSDYRWLPSTAANRQLLTISAAVPAGFTQVPSSPPASAGAVSSAAR